MNFVLLYNINISCCKNNFPSSYLRQFFLFLFNLRCWQEDFVYGVIVVWYCLLVTCLHRYRPSVCNCHPCLHQKYFTSHWELIPRKFFVYCKDSAKFKIRSWFRLFCAATQLNNFLLTQFCHWFNPLLPQFSFPSIC